MSLRASILALILATSTACNSLSSPQNKVEEPEKTQGVAGVPAFLLDSSKYDSIKSAEDDRYSCVGALVTPSAKIIGSAVLIHPRAILTAQHCFALAEEKAEFYMSASGQLIKIVKVFLKEPYTTILPWNDIALCILEEDCYDPPCEIMKEHSDLTMGEKLTTVGWSLGYKKVSEPGVMKYYGTLLEDRGLVMRMLASRGSVYYGDSGGGVFEDTGKLAGIINFFRLEEETNEIVDNGAARVDVQYKWIDSILSREVCNWPWFE
jgi:hypothetical protein